MAGLRGGGFAKKNSEYLQRNHFLDFNWEKLCSIWEKNATNDFWKGKPAQYWLLLGHKSSLKICILIIYNKWYFILTTFTLSPPHVQGQSDLRWLGRSFYKRHGRTHSPLRRWCRTPRSRRPLLVQTHPPLICVQDAWPSLTCWSVGEESVN